MSETTVITTWSIRPDGQIEATWSIQPDGSLMLVSWRAINNSSEVVVVELPVPKTPARPF